MHIGRTSTYLSVEALKAAVVAAKAGKDVSLYERAVDLLAKVAPTESEAAVDQRWVEQTSREVKAETDRLEGELKGYKNNLIKESIRVRWNSAAENPSKLRLLIAFGVS